MQPSPKNNTSPSLRPPHDRRSLEKRADVTN